MPRYRVPLTFAAEVLGSFALGRRRDMARDCQRLLAGLPVQPRAEGQEHLPMEGSCIIVANHYERPGLWVGWGAFFAPKGTPPDTVARLETAIAAVTRESQVVEKMTSLGYEPGGKPQVEFAREVQADAERWRRTIQTVGFKPQ